MRFISALPCGVAYSGIHQDINFASLQDFLRDDIAAEKTIVLVIDNAGHLVKNHLNLLFKVYVTFVLAGRTKPQFTGKIVTFLVGNGPNFIEEWAEFNKLTKPEHGVLLTQEERDQIRKQHQQWRKEWEQEKAEMKAEGLKLGDL